MGKGRNKKSSSPSKKSQTKQLRSRQAQTKTRTSLQKAQIKRQLSKQQLSQKAIDIKTTDVNVAAQFKIEENLAVEGYRTKVSYINETFKSMYNDQYTTENVRDFLFKIDSVHDFTKDRGDKKLNEVIVNSLGFDVENNSYHKKVIYDDDLETNIFFWLLNTKEIVTDVDKERMDFRPSIQEFQSEVKDYDITVDAGLKEYTIFKKLITSDEVLERKQKLEKVINSENQNLLNLYNISRSRFINTNNKDPLYYILYSYGQNLSYWYENILKAGDYDEYTKNTKSTRSNINYNERLKTYLLNLNKKELNKIKENLRKENSNFSRIIIDYIQYIESPSVIKDKDTFKSSRLDFKEDLSVTIYKQKELNKFLTKDTKFKIIAPQKFDANRSTGAGDDPTLILHLNGCKDPQDYETDCSFNILDDTCYFYFNNNKYIFEIQEYKDDDSENYPILKIKIVNKDKLKGYITGYQSIERFKYKADTRTLVCDNSPGVSELLKLYYYFSDIAKYKNKSASILKNILQIKRAGDYSQIWFCKKWNDDDANRKKLFFMSNDRQSASFCLLEKVPYIGQIGYYNFYYNPEGKPITKLVRFEKMLIEAGSKSIENILLSNTRNILRLYDFVKDINEQVASYMIKYLEIIYNLQDANVDEDDIKNLVVFSNIISNVSDIITEDDKDYEIPDSTERKINMLIDALNTKEREIKITENTKTLNLVYNKAIEIITNEDYYIEYIQDLANSLGILVPEGYQSISKDLEEIDYSEEKDILDSIEIVKISYPDREKMADFAEKLQKVKNGISVDYILCDMDFLISYTNNLYNKMLEKLRRKVKLNEVEVNEYKNKVNLITNCINSSNVDDKTIANDINNYIKELNIVRPKPQRPQQIEDDQMAFSFQNGLTYYHIQPKMPSTIDMKKYHNANHVHMMDNKGILSVKKGGNQGHIHLKDLSNKSKDYTDGTHISYRTF